MDTFINLLIFLGIVIGILGIGIGGAYIKRKFSIKNSDIEIGEKVIKLLIAFLAKSDFKYSGDIKVLAGYVFEAINFVERFEVINLSEKKKLVKERAMLICLDNDVKVDSEIVKLIDDIIDFFI